jgi:tetratricopeptide (TPR) repeat protein
MVCPHCGHSSAVDSGCCARCGAPFPRTSVLTYETPIDTTGLPPGADFGASTPVGPSTLPTSDAMATIASEPSAAAVQHGPLRVGQAFGPRHHIIKMLGAGGMGAVYQAWDSELGVTVALKVIRGIERAALPDVEKRFKNELLIARSVTHKNVVRIHDLGEIDRIKYITMTYVQGHDLATVLRRDRKFPIPRALRMARQIAAGMEAAHDAGVVHRDLKPANIMVGADDLALIMDFGISASASEAATGGITGTLEYMAPEQAAGGQVDARADTYAFGLILYEMLTGPRLVTAATPEDRVDSMRHRTTSGLPSPRTLDPAIPEALDALVGRCLERDPAARFQTTGELCAQLARFNDKGELIPELTKVSRRMIAAAGVAVAVFAAATYVVGQRTAPSIPVTHPIVSVLVADFDNRTGDAVLDGTLGAQALSIALEGAPYVALYSSSDARALALQLSKDHSDRLTDETSRIIARREGIKVLVAGSIEKSGGAYRLSVRATDPVTDGTVVAANVTAPDRAGVLHAIETLAGRVRLALGESKTEMEKVAAAETFTAGSLDAMQAYAHAQDLVNTGKVQEALRAYDDAVARDPQLGRAYSGMGIIYRNLGQMDKADAMFKEALKHVDRMTDREKYRTLGAYYLSIARNYPKAIETYDTLVARYPADQAGLSNLALANAFMRNFERAEAVSRELVRLYPTYLLGRTNHASYALYAGNFPTAIAEAQEALKQNPGYQFVFLPLALAQLSKGDRAAGLDTYERFENLNPFGASLAKLGIADVAMYRGQHRSALKQLPAAIATDETAKEKAAAAAKYVALAEAYAALDRRENAVAAARRAAVLGADESVLFPAALTLIWAGREDEAREIGKRLGAMLENPPRSYADLISGEISRRHGRLPEALDAMREGQKRHDSWWSRFLLGRVYEELGHHPEAVAELELAVKRRGEAADAFIADTPMLRYIPPVYYWLARAQEGMQAAPAARRSYDQFLALRGESDVPDPLITDAKKRTASLTH